MDLGLPEEHRELWEMPADLMREFWIIARDAQWSGWNPKWKQACCPACGGPKSMAVHELGCRIQSALSELEKLFPQVTRPLRLNPEEHARARALFGDVLGGLQKEGGEDDGLPKLKPFWEA